MHPFNPPCEITNSSICIFPRVKFATHDPVVHHSGHNIKRRVEVNVSFFDMHVSNIAWYLKIGGAPFRDDGVIVENLDGSGPHKGTLILRLIINLYDLHEHHFSITLFRADKFCIGGLGNQPE
ncbi:hypothetical protein Tco_1523521 [Tanacetum coccineum]